MAGLITTANLADPDETYNRLIDAHRDLTLEESQAFNARLILILANHIGDRAVLDEALAAAREPAG